MGVTHAEFFRNIPRVLTGEILQTSDTGCVISGEGTSVRIELGDEGERRIALIVLPVTQVTIHFSGFDEETKEAFLQRFDRAFQRGGG